MSVDVEKRTLGLMLIRAWMSGEISNYQLEDQWPNSASDRSLAAIAEQLWLMYDDFPEKHLVLTTLSKEKQDLLDRICAFLDSTREYEWPTFSYRTGNVCVLKRIMPGARKRIEENIRRFEANGDISYWPFLNENQLQIVKHERSR